MASLGAALALGGLLLSRAAAGQSLPSASLGSRSAARTAPTLVLVYEAEQPGIEPLVSAVESHLFGVPVRVELAPLPRAELLKALEMGRPQPHSPPLLGTIVIDLPLEGEGRLFFLGTEAPAVLLRQLRVGGANIGLDEAGVAVRSLTEALLESNSVEPVRPRDEPAAVPLQAEGARARNAASPLADRNGALPEAATALPEAAHRRSVVSLFAGPVVGAWLVDQPWQAGLGGGVSLAASSTWSFALAYTWQAPSTYRSQGADVVLSRRPFSLTAAYEFGGKFAPALCLGLGVDAVTRETVATAAGRLRTAAATTWLWGPIAAVEASTNPDAPWRLQMSLGAQVLVRRVDYAVEGAGVALASRRVSPFARLTLAWGP